MPFYLAIPVPLSCPPGHYATHTGMARTLYYIVLVLLWNPVYPPNGLFRGRTSRKYLSDGTLTVLAIGPG
jgi:hypothetical protein